MKVDFLGPTPVRNIIEAVLTRPRMYTILGSPAECICFLTGYVSGNTTHDNSNELWSEFSAWLRQYFRTSMEELRTDVWNEFVQKYGNDDSALATLRNIYQQYKRETFGEQYVEEIRRAAREGKSLREIFFLLRSRIQPSWSSELPIVTIEHFLLRAFHIPLRTLREIESWNGFSEAGVLTDADMEKLLGQWIYNEPTR